MDNLKSSLMGLSPEKRKLLEIMLKEQGLSLSGDEVRSSDEITSYEREGRMPLSYAERRLWFLEQLEPGSPLYVIPMGIKLTGKLSEDILEDSLNEVIARHEIFRTNYVDIDGKPARIIHPELRISIKIKDLTAYGASEKENEICEIISAESRKGFDLTNGPLLRATLIKEDKECYKLLLIMHHIISDNWSTGILMHELTEVYNSMKNGLKPNLAELKVQYADYAVWQNEYLKEDVISNQLEFWKRQLEGCSQRTEIYPDKISAKKSHPEGAFEIFNISGTLRHRLLDLCRREDTTLFMLLITAFEVLIYRYSGQYDFNIGYPIANRNHSGIENTIGFFVNTLVLRSNLKNNLSFIEVLKKNKLSILESFDNQDVPFEMLVEKLKLQGETDTNPLFQVMFVLNNAPLEAKKLDGVNYEVLDIDNGTSKFDLVLSMFDEANGVKGKLEFNSDMFGTETIRQMCRHFNNILLEIAADPETEIDFISLSDNSEKEKLNLWSGKEEKIYLREECLYRLFEQQALETPERIAIRTDDEVITYNELNRKANRLANYLVRQGIKSEDAVGVFLKRSIDSIVSFLAVMKAGGSYVPLEVSYPSERLKFIVEDSDIKILVSKTALEELMLDLDVKKLYLDSELSLIDQEDQNNLQARVLPENVAYIIYTSGSTGRPKGVLVEHRSITEHCHNIVRQYEINMNDRILQFASLIFDASIEQIFSALITGAELILRGEDVWLTSEFKNRIKDYGLTVINPPTIYWQQLATEWSQHKEGLDLESVRLVIAGGDTMNISALKQWQQIKFKKDIRLLNAYGPTETTITATIFDVPPQFCKTERKVPIGYPTSGRRAYILDKKGDLSPVGIPGELFIGGLNLARGYKNHPELTAERFIPDSFSGAKGARLYRTGDLARWLPTGEIEFLGRVDEQVKIRGFRIELEEIEHILKQCPHINDAIVLVKETKPMDKKLAAFLVSEFKNGSVLKNSPAALELRGFLSEKLPEYMIPSEYVYVENYPLLNSGKVDRKSLLKLKTIPLEVARQYIAPRSEMEEKISEIISRVLNIQKVGVYDNFFELGGHSMLAMQAVSLVRQEFQIDFPLKTFFEKPDISQLTKEIVKLQAEQIDPEILESILSEMEKES